MRDGCCSTLVAELCVGGRHLTLLDAGPVKAPKEWLHADLAAVLQRASKAFSRVVLQQRIDQLRAQVADLSMRLEERS